jgi:nucleoside-diphosphate-sugar epimerase
MINVKDTALVSDPAGYLTLWNIKELLNKGHDVDGPVFSLQQLEKIQHLLVLQKQYPGQLLLFEADLLAANSFNEVMTGCTIAIHAASSLFEKLENPQTELFRYAVEGTSNIMSSANKIGAVKHLLLTSSVALLYSNACDIYHTKNHTVTEADKNIYSNLGEKLYAYFRTITEKTAWNMQLQSRWNPISIHLGAVPSPSLPIREFCIKNILPRFEGLKILTWLIAPFIGMQRIYLARDVNQKLQFNTFHSKK